MVWLHTTTCKHNLPMFVLHRTTVLTCDDFDEFYATYKEGLACAGKIDAQDTVGIITLHGARQFQPA